MGETFPEASRDETLAAYRLAGQGLIAWLSGVAIHYLRLRSDCRDMAVLELPPIGHPIAASREEAQTVAHIKLAGLIAVETYRFGHAYGVQAVNFLDVMLALDREAYREAARLGAYVHGSDRSEHAARMWSNIQTTCCLPRHWNAIETLARTLLLDRELAGCEVAETLCHALSRYEPPEAE